MTSFQSYCRYNVTESHLTSLWCFSQVLKSFMNDFDMFTQFFFSRKAAITFVAFIYNILMYISNMLVQMLLLLVTWRWDQKKLLPRSNVAPQNRCPMMFRFLLLADAWFLPSSSPYLFIFALSLFCIWVWIFRKDELGGSITQSTRICAFCDSHRWAKQLHGWFFQNWRKTQVKPGEKLPFFDQ